MPSAEQSTPCTEEEDKTQGFYPWMLVSRRKRQIHPAVVCEPGVASTNSIVGAGSQDKTRSTMNNRFRYSSLEKGKKAQSAGLRNKGLAVQTEPTSNIPVGEFSEHTEPIISVSGGPTIKMSSVQSSPSKQNSNLKTKPSSNKVIPSPQAPSNSLISLRP
jgi:hypothetical protein